MTREYYFSDYHSDKFLRLLERVHSDLSLHYHLQLFGHRPDYRIRSSEHHGNGKPSL